MAFVSAYTGREITNYDHYCVGSTGKYTIITTGAVSNMKRWGGGLLNNAALTCSGSLQTQVYIEIFAEIFE